MKKQGVQVISDEIFKDKAYGGVLDIDDVHRYLLSGSEEDIPLEIGFAALFICQSGEAELMLDMRAYRIQAGDLCVVFPHSVIQGIRKSDDFDGYALGGNLNYLSTIRIPSSVKHFIRISDNPCISLTAEEQGKLLRICEVVRSFQDGQSSHVFHEEVVNKLLLALCYEIVGIYTQRDPIGEQVYSREDTIFRKFMFSLAKNCKTHRKVEFYAAEQCLTPRYFSSVVRNVSGEHAACWIRRAVLIEAKKLLANSTLTMQQIADELSFPNPSFFGQFFKKNMGMTPKAYRDSL